MSEWPLEHVVKVLCFYHPDDSAALKAEQEATVVRLFHAARRKPPGIPAGDHPVQGGPRHDTTSAEVIQRFYDLGVFPDWWKLEPFATEAAWDRACAPSPATIRGTRGVVVLGLDAEEMVRAGGLARPGRAASIW